MRTETDPSWLKFVRSCGQVDLGLIADASCPENHRAGLTSLTRTPLRCSNIAVDAETGSRFMPTSGRGGKDNLVGDRARSLLDASTPQIGRNISGGDDTACTKVVHAVA